MLLLYMYEIYVQRRVNHIIAYNTHYIIYWVYTHHCKQEAVKYASRKSL